MAEKAQRWNYGNETEITAQELIAAYEAAPACHHPRPMGTVAFNELARETKNTILNDESQDLLDEIDSLQGQN